MKQIVVARTDGSAHDQAVVRWASQEATARGLPLRVIHGPPAVVPGRAQLVVAGTHAQDALAFSACPVVLVPGRPSARGSTEIVLGADAREPAQGALDFAFGIAWLRGVLLHAVHAWRLPSCAAELPFGVPEEDRGGWEDDEVQLLSDVLRPWREKYPEVPVLEDVRLLTPARALVQRSASAGLLVVGRKSGAEPGPITRVILRESRCPVAVVPS